MESQGLVNHLIEAGVLQTGSEGKQLGLTPEFQAELADETDRLVAASIDDRKAMVDTVVQDPDPRARLKRVIDTDPAFIAVYLTLTDWTEDILRGRGLGVALTLYQLREQAPRDDGAPNHFLPIHGESLGLVASLYDRSIAYIWRDNCPTCDTVRGDFDELFETGPPADLALVSIYGPDSAEYLDEEFDVIGGPTVLFLLNGQVDVRLQGAHGQAVLEKEVETIQTRTVEAP